MVRKHASLDRDEELNAASRAAARGAVVGAAKWGIFSAAAAGLGYAFSPMYRGLTLQFKAFLQMSGMTTGSMIEADRRLRAHEVMVRRQRVVARDAQVWKRYESDFLEKAADDRIEKSK
ncbi:hypothetical protein LTR91_008792 [Friedmanniomyces endolithicus]|uniref:Imidazoleglycerol-phosphate dehydratase n=1 Tax=Friedmanniomyces endolithicus TaxID=329885 RepID=A0A4U0UQS0_9PEZI|nr:hypothetical protein LTS09_001459 [Friedmanniomyces endolithicus]KAK0291868.1 hypothetical protein LTR35_001296 [Friedmanniomyces endolithicus]KAK0296456.1 hypothetical protein LTS00_004781 [Friedmanniomyces endolithicus]KAK0309770.1 hypothetical protein LTR01_003967 [Friedmanniomyces endolithicus]KAK0324583.1 hypothetical protein LTR82_004288 [Friedmanniomyces endolithicus]